MKLTKKIEKKLDLHQQSLIDNERVTDQLFAEIINNGFHSEYLHAGESLKEYVDSQVRQAGNTLEYVDSQIVQKEICFEMGKNYLKDIYREIDKSLPTIIIKLLEKNEQEFVEDINLKLSENKKTTPQLLYIYFYQITDCSVSKILYENFAYDIEIEIKYQLHQVDKTTRVEEVFNKDKFENNFETKAKDDCDDYLDQALNNCYKALIRRLIEKYRDEKLDDYAERVYSPFLRKVCDKFDRDGIISIGGSQTSSMNSTTSQGFSPVTNLADPSVIKTTNKTPARFNKIKKTYSAVKDATEIIDAVDKVVTAPAKLWEFKGNVEKSYQAVGFFTDLAVKTISSNALAPTSAQFFGLMGGVATGSVVALAGLGLSMGVNHLKNHKKRSKKYNYKKDGTLHFNKIQTA